MFSKRAARGWSLGVATAVVSGWTLNGCALVGDDARTCNAYACSTNAILTATVPCLEESARFLVSLCHGSECSDASIAWVNGSGPICTQDLVPSDPNGFDEQRIVCASRAGNELVFEGRWDFGREGQPSVKQFTLRISDEASGELLLSETRSASFEPSEHSSDHCHDCRHADMRLGSSSGSCTPGTL
jgi:hypothetical protein